MLLRLMLLSLMASLASAQNILSCYAPGTELPAEFVLSPFQPGKWGNPALGTAATVTYSFASRDYSRGLEGPGVIRPLETCMPAGFKAEIERAFAAWAAVADIEFVEVPDSGTAFDAAGATGDIRIGCHQMDGQFGELAHAYFPPAFSPSAPGDMHFDSDETWKIGFGGDPDAFDIFQVAAHEIGHAIGLLHEQVTVTLMNPFYTEEFAGPQPDDAAGAQTIYGVIPANRPATQGSVDALTAKVDALAAKLDDETQFTDDAELAAHLDAVKAALAQSQNAAHADTEALRTQVGQLRDMVEWIANAVYKTNHHSSSSSSSS